MVQYQHLRELTVRDPKLSLFRRWGVVIVIVVVDNDNFVMLISILFDVDDGNTDNVFNIIVNVVGCKVDEVDSFRRRHDDDFKLGGFKMN